jgi:hypothetical protein
MQKKNIVRFGFIAVLLAASLLALRSSGNTTGNSTCKESLEKCPKKEEQNKGTAPGMIWESLSRQFFSSVLSSH